MDVIDVFLQRHAALRAELAALAEPFKRPHGVGWDDCLSLDRERLLGDVDAFFSSFRDHEATEDELLAELSERIELDAGTRAAFAEKRRAVADIMKLFGAVAFTCDGEHVHRVRELLSRMSEEVEAHLAYEEKVMFPLMRARLPADALLEFADRARQREARGPSRR